MAAYAPPGGLSVELDWGGRSDYTPPGGLAVELDWSLEESGSGTGSRVIYSACAAPSHTRAARSAGTGSRFAVQGVRQQRARVRGRETRPAHVGLAERLETFTSEHGAARVRHRPGRAVTGANRVADALIPARDAARRLTLDLQYAGRFRMHTGVCRLLWTVVEGTDAWEGSTWYGTLALRHGRSIPWPRYQPDPLAVTFPLHGGYRPPRASRGIVFLYGVLRPSPVPGYAESTLRLREPIAYQPGPGVRVRWGPVPGVPGTGHTGGIIDPPPPEPHEPFIIPTRAYYMRLHDLSVVRLPDRLALPWRSLTLRTDASQWAWTMSLELLGRDAAALIDPGPGDVVQVEIAINGATWICLAEDWTESSQHGQWTTVSVTGRSLSALLSRRYARARSYTETDARTLGQLAAQELPQGSDWTLLWEPATWLVPAGAWSYQDLSPIDAIARLAGEAGGLVYAAPAAKSLTVRPVYHTLPWDYGAGDEDLLVPESALVGAVSRRYRYPDQATAVHIYGAEVGGIQGRVYPVTFYSLSRST